MNDDVAIAMLAAVTAVVAAFRFVGASFLDDILDETDEPPSPGMLDDAQLEKRRAMIADGSTTWPLLSVVAVGFVWVPTSAFVVKRCWLLAGTSRR